jgi:D-serine deaminase-like pyridoxal phosphate-dependent protein
LVTPELTASHAGCYCLNDLQQLATGLIPPTACALTVLARVVSTYPERGDRGEAMSDCGALAVSKDTGPVPGYGRVMWPEHLAGWDLGRVSQEHGTLVKRDGDADVAVGDLVRILPQHACLVCAAHPWLYVVEDGGETVADVWVTWKGW